MLKQCPLHNRSRTRFWRLQQRSHRGYGFVRKRRQISGVHIAAIYHFSGDERIRIDQVERRGKAKHCQQCRHAENVDRFRLPVQRQGKTCQEYAQPYDKDVYREAQRRHPVGFFVEP